MRMCYLVWLLVWQGFLNLNKDPGMTSHDCVGAVRRLLKERRVGHGGTLDPMALGVLPLAVGPMTRLLPYLQQLKGYRATVRFGVATTTDDLEGEPLDTRPAAHLTLPLLQEVLPRFVGAIEQVPPQFSAIRQGGVHLYELARAGVAVEVPSRIVQIYSLEVLSWQTGEFPEAVLHVSCGSGTYIRSLARDLGLALGSCATLAQLVRTQSGGFHLDRSLTLAQVQEALAAGTFHLFDPAQALHHLPRVDLDADRARAFCMGQQVTEERALGSEPVQVWQGEHFLGIAQANGQRLQPVTVLGSPR
ncbi:tRNA pseudouridine(55) synthase TruB [Anthocerotibacter panamensis]|uniref:tRNA pseudouridine(55) synthase TruB n=1 Tax=Anthocerotibacter panamensis TaxID=2857077 RepID=UPI001FD8960B|nr:tRNA pseudouridine(55) synthase TruB [Anthocerotibacter panamensis]